MQIYDSVYISLNVSTSNKAANIKRFRGVRYMKLYDYE